MEKIIVYFIQSIFLLAAAPLMTGIVRRMKAYARGYRGAPLLQGYYDYARLLKKGRIHSGYSSFITQTGPTLALAASVTVAMLVPVFYAETDNVLGNIFLIVFLLAVVKFFSALLGLDCASTFGGMGSSRELFISMLAEPVMFVSIAFLFMETKSFNAYEIAFSNTVKGQYSIEHIIAAAAFFILILAENARMPMDNPETHLELTMVHEAMLLDLSGRDLAYMEYASSVKLMIFLTLFVNCFVPVGLATELETVMLIKAIVLYLAKLIGCLAIIAVIETTMAKFRLFRLPEIMAAGFSIGIVAVAINFFI